MEKFRKMCGSYRDQLGQQERMQHFEKLRLTGDEEPYELTAPSCNENMTVWPSISCPDIVNYQQSYTQLKTLNVTKVWRPTARWCVDGERRTMTCIVGDQLIFRFWTFKCLRLLGFCV